MSEVIFQDIGLLPAFQNDGQLIEKISIRSIQQLDPDAIFLFLHKEPKPLLLSKVKAAGVLAKSQGCDAASRLSAHF